MGVNKIVIGGVTKLDLTKDSVTPSTLVEGITAHNAAGNIITGTMVPSKPSVAVYLGPLYGSNAYLQHLGTFYPGSYKYAKLTYVSHNGITANGNPNGALFLTNGNAIEVQLSGQAQGVPLSATLQLSDIEF